MATKAKEIAHHRREKSSSAPSTPRSISFPHSRRESTTDASYPHSRRESTTDADELLPLPRRPIPNYRKPTISSAHDTNCPNANKQHRTFIKKTRPIDKLLPTSPTSLPHKFPHSSNKEKSINTSEVNSSLKVEVNPNLKNHRKSQHGGQLQPSATFPRTSHTKSTTPVKVNVKVNTVVKPTRSTAKEKVKKGADHEHSPRDIHPVGHDDGGSEEHYEGSGESMAGESPAAAWREKPYPVAQPRRVKVRQELQEGEVANQGMKLMKHEGNVRKESPPASNQVIEETASKLATKRRNKVAALVGAFETVISQHEPEPEPSQPQLEEGEAKEEVKAAEVAVATEADNGDTKIFDNKEDEAISRDDNAAVIVEEIKSEENVEDGAVVAAAATSSSVTKEVTESSKKRDEGSDEFMDEGQFHHEE